MFVARGIRSPISPLSARHLEGRERHEIKLGRRLFDQANCASCHGGGGWASSRRDFTPPPAATEIVNTQLTRFLKPVGSFDGTLANELRANGAGALGADGFNPPSLLGDFALGPFLHNGSALTLADVMDLVPHRSAGTAGVDRLADSKDRAALVRFLESIDASTAPFGSGPEPGAEPDQAVATAPTPQIALSLAVAGPNPVRSWTRFAYSSPAAGRVALALFDVQGRRVASLIDRSEPAGRYTVDWDGRLEGGGVARAGVYFARLKTVAGDRVTRVVVAP